MNLQWQKRSSQPNSLWVGTRHAQPGIWATIQVQDVYRLHFLFGLVGTYCTLDDAKEAANNLLNDYIQRYERKS